jgi:hypothetical protein
VGEIVIFLTTSYDIIFWWWSYTEDSDQNFCWRWFVFQKIVESAYSDLTTECSGMAPPLHIPHSCTLCSVHCPAHPKVFTWLIDKMSSGKLESGVWFINQYTYITSWCKITALCKEVDLLVEMTNFSRPQIGIWGWTWQNWWSNFEAFLKHSQWLTGRRGDWWGWESSGCECVQIGRNLKHGYW